MTGKRGFLLECLALAGLLTLEGLMGYLFTSVTKLVATENAVYVFAALALQEVPMFILFPPLFRSVSESFAGHGMITGGPCLALTVIGAVLFLVFWPEKRRLFVTVALILFVVYLFSTLMLYGAARSQEQNRIQGSRR